jgi:tetratricopeptide (TPR) repeat protein/DNA-binding XRE family transcriptional regulator
MHPLRRARKTHNGRVLTQEQLADLTGLSKSTIERAEHGEPTNWYTQKQLCNFFGKTARELGLVDQIHGETTSEPEYAHEQVPLTAPLGVQQGVPAPVLLRQYQAIDTLVGMPEAGLDQQLGAWLALGAHGVAYLFDAGWSLEALLESLRVVLQGVQAMPKVTRRSLLQYGTAAVVSAIPVPQGRYVSEEDRIQLCNALGESIAAGWKLFSTAGNAQVLAVSQAQLILVQQNHSVIYPSVLNILYSGVYRLKGAALHFQERYEEAYKAHEQAYLVALEGADAWNMAQSRGWQAYGLKACGSYREALQAADAALRLVSQQDDRESIRLKARLLAFSAENAAILGNVDEVQARLSASEELLQHLPGQHEEFDRISWLQQAGNCALSLKQYDLARSRLQQALDEIPSQWALRFASTALSLASALAQMRELDEAIKVAKRALPTVSSVQSSSLIREFASYLQTELLANFPSVEQCRTFVVDAQQKLAIA